MVRVIKELPSIELLMDSLLKAEIFVKATVQAVRVLKEEDLKMRI